MKRMIALFLLLGLALIACPGCETVPETDVWDGSAAEAFGGGEGTENDPYRIRSAAQLAFLAQEVTAGESYAGKHFSLDCNLDLNRLGWTPIGNGECPFGGVFDGNGHSIANLSITVGTRLEAGSDPAEQTQYATGLFGSCADSVIRNLTIRNAAITLEAPPEQGDMTVGVLAGTVTADTTAEFSDVTISDAVIENRFQQKSSPATIIIGGVCGSVRNMPEANDTSAVTVARVQSDIRVSVRNGYGAYNFIGGIIGSMSLKGTGSIQDCASDLSVEIATDMESCYGYDKCFGAFGSMLAFNSTVTVANVFSKVAVNKIHDVFHGYEAFRANAIIGETSQYKQPDGTVTGELRLRNLFGFVEQTEESTGETEIDTQLYEIPDHAVYTATNCQGCEQLPEHHGLDENVWDLSDPAKPKLKES